MTSIAPPARIRIHSFISPTHFLHVEDATAIGKVRLFAGTYRPGTGATITLHHFIDLPDMRVLCHAIISKTFGYNYTESKGTLHDHRHATSRVLRLHTRPDEVWLELTTSPGTLTRTGTIVPDAQARDRALHVNVPLTWHNAQALAHTVYTFLHAWDIVRALHHTAQLQVPPEYGIYAPMQAEGEVTTYADDDLPQDLSPPAILTRARYSDGSSVPPEKTDEYTAFHTYLRTKGVVPPSRAVLLRWARSRRAPPTSTKAGSRHTP